jgi:hypothetical protein
MGGIHYVRFLVADKGAKSLRIVVADRVLATDPSRLRWVQHQAAEVQNTASVTPKEAARVMVSERVNMRTKWGESRLASRFRMNEELGCSELQTLKARTTFLSELTARVSPRPSRSF